MFTSGRTRRRASLAAIVALFVGAVVAGASRFLGREDDASSTDSGASRHAVEQPHGAKAKPKRPPARTLVAHGAGPVAAEDATDYPDLAARRVVADPQLPPVAVAPPPRPVYLDPLIDPGIADDPLFAESSGGGGLLPGNASIEYRAFNQESRGGYASGGYTEQGLGVQFQQETRVLGRLGMQAAAIDGSGDGAMVRNAESGEFVNIAQRDFALTDTLLMDNEVGHLRARAPLLLSQGHRVRLPEPLIEGVFSETRSRSASVKVASGALGNLQGRTFPIFSKESSSGKVTGLAGSAFLTPSVSAAAQAWQVKDVAQADGDDRFTSLAGAVRYDGGPAGNVQANALRNDTGATGLWFDGATRLGGWQHLGGLYRMDPRLQWLDRNAPVLSDTQGLYWQGSTRTFRANTVLGADVIQTNVDDDSSVPTRDASSVFGTYGYRVTPRLNLSAHLLLGTESVSGAGSTDSVTARGVVNNRFDSGQGTGGVSVSDRSGSNSAQRLDANWDYYWNPTGSFSGLRSGIAYVSQSGSWNDFDETALRMAGNWSDAYFSAGAGAYLGYVSGVQIESSKSASVTASFGWYFAPGWQLTTNLAYNHNALQVDGQSETRVSDRQAFVSVRYGAGWGRPEYPVGAVNGKYGRGAVRGVLFLDRNGNGVRDADEAGVPSVTVYLDGGYAVETNASGEFMFSPVASGEHTIRVNVANVPLPWVLDERPLVVSVQPRGTALIEIPLINQQPEQM